MQPERLNRRDFVRAIGLSAVGMAVERTLSANRAQAGPDECERVGEPPSRPIRLITQPVDLTPGPGAHWAGKATLVAGFYLLTITYGEGGITNEGYPRFPEAPYSPYAKGRGSARLQVTVGGRLIADAQLPPMPSGPGLLRQAAVPFLCESPGENEIELAAMLGGSDDHIEIKEAVLSSVQPRPVPHTLQRSLPERPLRDHAAWVPFMFAGSPMPLEWPPGRGVGPDEIEKYVLKPGWKRGFNMVWTIAQPITDGGCPFPWDEAATGMPMPETYSWLKDPRWQVEGYRRYLQDYVHKRNMLDVIYWPSGPWGVPWELSKPGGQASIVRHFDRILNALRYDRDGLVDGISDERYCTLPNTNTTIGSRELVLAHVNQLLQSNPGASVVSYISGVDSARECMAGDMPNGLEPYSHGYFTGHEDCLSFAPDPWLLRTKGGKKYRWHEVWVEDGGLVPEGQRKEMTPAEIASLPVVYGFKSIYEGFYGEDYIIKEMNDMARRRLLDPDQCDALSAFVWYTDCVYVSPTNFEMTYAISQDPVRAAVAGQLRSLGQGGRLRSLYPYSANSHFLQNNYLALFLPEGKARGELLYDFQRTAHFTPFSYSIALSRNFLEPSAPGTSLMGANTEVLERGGYRSVVRSQVRLQSWQTDVKETQTYELTSDTSYLVITLDDEMIGPDLPLTHVLAGEGFDQLLIGGEIVQSGSLSLPESARLRDTTRLRPDVVFLFLEAPEGTLLQWSPGRSLAVTRTKVGRLRLAVVVPTDLYAQDQLSPLARRLSQPDPVLSWKDGPMKVTNRSKIPVTEAVTLRGADDRPYLVEEGGWWTFRGAQVSKQLQNTDLLKVYLPPGSEATILPWGFIGGVARPGRGCQYILALGDVKKTSEGGSYRVRVLNETPMIFAPRVEFAWPIAEVSLNGKLWHYFDGQEVFLPQKKGRAYDLSVRRGEPSAPHLSRTYANIRSTDFSDDTLTFRATAPPWRLAIPEGIRLTAQVEHPGRELMEVEGGKRLKGVPGKSIISIEPGTVRVHFRNL